MSQKSYPKLNILFFLIYLLLSCLATVSIANEGPALLKKTEKKEKLREEDLVIKEIDINDLTIKKYLNIDLVKSIFNEATSFGEIDETTLSVPVYQNEKEIGFLFETFDVTRGLGYSRRPFNLAVGVDNKGIIRNVKLLKHVEPIAILGRTDQDFIDYLDQYKNTNLKSGISLTLELTGADIEGDSVAMRETAGEVDSLTKIDGVSRTTTSSLLFMDAIMRGARKIARQKNIILDKNDLGNFIDLELYNQQDWKGLINDKSLSLKTISIFDLQESFKNKKLDAPRSIRFKGEEELFVNIYMANVSPAGIGVNILGRRWFDQYISAGRNVDDQVYYIAFEGKNWISLEDRIGKIIENKNILLKQGNIEISIDKKLFKELPFNHAKNSPNIAGQGLIYISSKYKLNPQLPIDLVYKINNKENNSIYLNTLYALPKSYYLKEFVEVNNSNKKESNTINTIWKNNKLNILLLIITTILSSAILIFNNSITKNRKLFFSIRVLFLSWIVVWLGWIVGGQLSIIHLVNLFKLGANFGGDITTFLIEPVILLLGLITILSLFIWGRALFCGWLCPFGALQEILAIISRNIGIKQIILPKKIDQKLRYIKYILLMTIIIGSLLEINFINYFYNIEPFKTAITLRFIAPYKVVMWAVLLLLVNLYLERAYCRFLCPLGGGLALLGKVRLISFLKRKKECGNPCKACNQVCPTGAIQITGKIDMNECLGCLDCQVMYNDYDKCPPLVAIRKEIKV